jgi:hypothetical protein
MIFLTKEKTMYYSSSKRKNMNPEDMHMMHLENVLLKDLRDDSLGWRETNELTQAYIAKVKAYREQLNREHKAARAVNRLLLDVVLGKAVKVRRQPADLLEVYRQEALKHIGYHGRISADTLRDIIRMKGIPLDGAVLPNVFRDKRFEQIGYHRSTWPGARGRFINIWSAA